MSYIFNLIISHPLYNGLIFLMNLLPFFDAGVIIIIFTVIVKIIMLPLSIKATKAQLQMKSIEKDIEQIKTQHKDNKEELARKTMEYYKEKGVNPFASIIILVVQIPLIIGLYQVFLHSGLPGINTAILYSFVSVPDVANIKMMFLGLVDIAGKSLGLAILAGITTYFQISLASSSQTQPGVKQGDFARAMSMQMKYVFPIIVVFISYKISAALAIYWITSNLFAIGQEMYIKRKYHQQVSVV